MSASTKHSFGVKGLLVTALALLANVVVADSDFMIEYGGPSHSTASTPAQAVRNGIESRDTMGPGECDVPCRSWTTGGVIADFSVYSDPDCQALVDNPQLIIGRPMKACPNNLLPTNTGRDRWPKTVYMQPGGGFHDGAQLAFTINQKPRLGENNDARYVRYVVTQGTNCLKTTGINTNWGMKFVPCGSGGLV